MVKHTTTMKDEYDNLIVILLDGEQITFKQLAVYQIVRYETLCQKCGDIPSILVPHAYKSMRSKEYAASMAKPGSSFYPEGTYLCQACCQGKPGIRVIWNPPWVPCGWCLHPIDTHLNNDGSCVIDNCQCPWWD